MTEFNETFDLDVLRRKAKYLEVIHEFALSQVDLNSLDEILWNVAKTAIAKLGFVDCVIYLLDEDGTTLIQKAAHGPKNPVAQDILDPITIQVGQGIVGSVAKTGEVELVADTRTDPRYIIDDAKRLSELAVPIIHQGKVIGVLDSEHPDVGFFTEDHVQLLSTIASLASTRIDTALAMERLQSTVEQLQSTERSLERKAEELREAKNKADRASRQKSSFLANMSHELRTPLTSTVGYGDLLTRPGKSSEERFEWAEQVRRNADHLLGLMNDVLDLAKIESGKFKPDISSCELNDLVTDVCALMRPQAEAKGLYFKVRVIGPMPLVIETDSLRLRQTMVNLISNAVKYTDEGGIDIRLHSAANLESGHLEFIVEVEDTGVGIHAETLEQIFEPFIQDKETAHKSFGTGLGLSISQNFARMLGGGIEVESKPGRGSLFTLRIDCGPLDKTVRVASKFFDLRKDKPRDRISPIRRLDNLTVHVVEDSVAIGVLLRHLLEEAGAEVRHSANGQEAVDSILAARDQDRLPDLILMDMLMPVMDGYTAATTLRQAGIKTPIVAMTALAFLDDRDKCLESGCDVYMSKPIDPASFIEQLSACIRCEIPPVKGRSPVS